MISEPPEAPAIGREAEFEVQPPVPEAEPPRRSRRLLAIVLLALAVLGLVLWVRHTRASSAAAAAGAAAKADRPIPVAVASAARKDVNVYLDGLGTVAASNSVAVKSRVDGQLMRLDFREGQTVRAGDVLAELDPRPFQVQMQQAQGQLAKDEAALRNAEVDVKRYQALYAQDAVPKQQLDTAVAAVGQFRGSVESDQAQVSSAQLNLTYSRITAPLSGRLGLRQVDIGNIVHISDPNGIVVITQLQPIVVFFTLPADQIPQVMPLVHAGKTLLVEAWDRDLTHHLATGKLFAVDNAIDPTTGTVRLKALFDNADQSLFPDQFVNARLLVQVLNQATTVPTAAIQHSPQGSYVYLVQPDRTVASRDVVVQLTEGDDAVISSGLAPGDTVVVDGVDKLHPGSKVELSKGGPGAAPSGGGPGGTGSGKGGRRGRGSAGAVLPGNGAPVGGFQSPPGAGSAPGNAPGVSGSAPGTGSTGGAGNAPGAAGSGGTGNAPGGGGPGGAGGAPAGVSGAGPAGSRSGAGAAVAPAAAAAPGAPANRASGPGSGRGSAASATSQGGAAASGAAGSGSGAAAAPPSSGGGGGIARG